jgi:hypothetical protein
VNYSALDVEELGSVYEGLLELQPTFALRDVIANCIYGVDKNPLAVELCKVALWLESYIEAKPLSFLDHRILVGNSLVGVWNLGALKDGIPEDAYKPVTGDDKDVAKDAKAANKRQLRLKGQMRIFAPDLDLGELGKARHDLAAIPDDTPDLVRQKRVLLDRFPEDKRVFPIPRGKGGIEPARIWYADEPEDEGYKSKVLAYIASGGDSNRCSAKRRSRHSSKRAAPTRPW